MDSWNRFFSKTRMPFLSPNEQCQSSLIYSSEKDNIQFDVNVSEGVLYININTTLENDSRAHTSAKAADPAYC